MGAEASLSKWAIYPELTFGESIAGNPALQLLRGTGETLGIDVTTVLSPEITGSRRTKDVIRTGLRAAGDFNFVYSYEANEQLWLASQFSAGYSSPVNVDVADTAISAAASDNSFNHSTAWAINPTQYQWIRVSGFTTAANNGIFKVLSVTGTKIIVSGGTLVNESATPAVTIVQGAQSVDGSTATSFNFERQYDVANIFPLLRGIMVNTVGLTIPTDGLITGSYGLIGKDEVSPTPTSTIGDGSPTAAPTYDVMSSVEHLTKVLVNNVVHPITGLTMNINNRLAERLQAGSLGSIAIGVGTAEMSGTIAQYMNNTLLYDLFLSFGTVPMAFVLTDASGNSTVHDFPAVKFTAGRRPAESQNSPVIKQMGWSAKEDPTEQIMWRTTKFAA